MPVPKKMGGAGQFPISLTCTFCIFPYTGGELIPSGDLIMKPAEAEYIFWQYENNEG